MSTVGINNNVGATCPAFLSNEGVVPAEFKYSSKNEATDRSRFDSRYRNLSDAMLLNALKAEESGAFIEIVARYQAIMFRYARNLGIDTADRKAWVSDLFNDVVLSLLRPGAVVPNSLAAYLVRACHNRAYADHRAAERRYRHEADAVGDEHEREGAVLSTCSEDAIRNSRGAAWKAAGLPSGLVKLVSKLEASMTPGERQLLDWSSESVPLRLIAEWLGINRAAAGQRVSRLKERLRVLAPKLVSDFSDHEQREVNRFFSRVAGIEDRIISTPRLTATIGRPDAQTNYPRNNT